MNSVVIDHGDNFLLQLASQTVSRCYVDYAVGIQFFEMDPEITIKIESSFEYIRNGEQYVIDPQSPETIGPMLGVFGKKISKATVNKNDGMLEIIFEDMSKLTVHSDSSYEAWEVIGDNNALVVCMPGGELALWDDVV